MYNSGLLHQSSVANNNNQSYSSSNNPEVNEIIRRHEEIANNIKKMRSSSQIPVSYLNRSYTPVGGSFSNLGDSNNNNNDDQVETIITTTTMKVTPQQGNSYSPLTYQRSNNFFNPTSSSSQPSNNSDLLEQLKKANQNIVNISQDISNFNDNIKKSQLLGNSVRSSNYSNNNFLPVSPIKKVNNSNYDLITNSYQPSVINSQFLNVGNSYNNPRSSSVYSSRSQLPQTSTYHQSLYPATRGASQTRITEITTTTYNHDEPLPQDIAASTLTNSRANLAYSRNHTPKHSVSNNIPSLTKFQDQPEENNDFVKRIYVKGDGFEYEEIVDEENPLNNVKQLRDNYHNEWQRLDYTPEFVIPFLEIQEKQKNASTTLSQINMSQIQGVQEAVKNDYRSNNNYNNYNSNNNNSHSNYFLDQSNVYRSYADTTANNISQSHFRDIPTVKSYMAINPNLYQ